MSWFRRGAASVLHRELGRWPYPKAFARVLRNRDRVPGNGLELVYLLFGIYLLFTVVLVGGVNL